MQYLLIPPPAPTVNAATANTPQDAAMSRGMVKADAQTGTQFLMLASSRQVFTTYDGARKVVEYDSSAYPMDLVGGPQQMF